MSLRGELNVGQLCRQHFGASVYNIGFGTDHGTVAAASGWDEPMDRMRVRPSHPESYECLFHESELPALLLPLRHARRAAIVAELGEPRLERAIGVVYKPDTELQSHYFHAILPRQFDEYIWFDETRAVTPLAIARQPTQDLPETYPFGL
jgi:erythromycin esterase-like protein